MSSKRNPPSHGTIPSKEADNDDENVEADEDGNEHALRYVIENVDSLCNEYSNAPSSVDGPAAMHFDLSTAKILDELEMPTITHAKHEAELLTRLQNSLSRLIEHSREKLKKPRVIERLQSFREEIQKLLNSSSTGGRVRRKVKFSRPIADASTVMMAEREETPFGEAMKTDHANDRSERVTELDANAFRKLAKTFANAEKKVIGSSTDSSMATKTPSPIAYRSKPDERSQAIWSSEDTIGRAAAGSIDDEDKGVDDVVTKLQPKPSSTKNDIPKKQLHNDAPARSVPFSASANQTNESSIIERRAVAPRRRESDGNKGFWTCVLIALGVAAVFVLALRGAFGRNIRLTVWQTSCTVANTFCENYGVMCTRYCASGMLREKWHRSHS